MSTSQPESSPSGAQEATQLAASTDNASSKDTGNDTDSILNTPGSTTSSQPLSRIDDFLSRVFIIVIVTGVIQLGSTLVVTLMTEYELARFEISDFSVQWTAGHFLYAVSVNSYRGFGCPPIADPDAASLCLVLFWLFTTHSRSAAMVDQPTLYSTF